MSVTSHCPGCGAVRYLWVGSNHRHRDHESRALPSELHRHGRTSSPGNLTTRTPSSARGVQFCSTEFLVGNADELTTWVRTVSLCSTAPGLYGAAFMCPALPATQIHEWFAGGSTPRSRVVRRVPPQLSVYVIVFCPGPAWSECCGDEKTASVSSRAKALEAVPRTGRDTDVTSWRRLLDRPGLPHTGATLVRYPRAG